MPLVIATGQAFLGRNLIIELTFGVILAKLVGQGLSLIPLIRILQLQTSTVHEEELQQARLEAAHAALAKVEEFAQANGVAISFLAHLRARYEQQIQRWSDQAYDAEQESIAEQGITHQHICTEVIHA